MPPAGAPPAYVPVDGGAGGSGATFLPVICSGGVGGLPTMPTAVQGAAPSGGWAAAAEGGLCGTVISTPPRCRGMPIAARLAAVRSRVRRVRERLLDVCADDGCSLGAGMRMKAELDHADLLCDIAASHLRTGGLDAEARRRVREADAVVDDVWVVVRPRRRTAGARRV